MGVCELFGVDPTKVSGFLYQIFGVSVSVDQIQVYLNVIVFGLILFLIVKYGYKGITIIWNLFPCSNKKCQQEYIHNALDHDFKGYLDKKAQQEFIETQFLSCPPHDFDEPNKATTASTREAMAAFCDRIFKEDNPNERVYMVLAGSGMGKTTFMVNLFCHYVKGHLTRKGIDLDIRLLRLDDDKVLDKISRISDDKTINPNKTILLLDALDENRNAAESFSEFKCKLEEAIEPYRLVMITCRDQFFDNESTIPQSTNWVATTKDKNLISYNKIYISPFSDKDVKVYLAKKYRSGKTRKKAIKIAEKCKTLMVRPLLLSYMDDLMDGKAEFESLYKIYELLIDKWLQREVNKIPNETTRNERKACLYKFSEEIAKTIYQNWINTKTMQLSPEQMDEFMKRFNFDTIPYQFKQRSLINRDINGYCKFAHKSFLEYFLAKIYFEDSSFRLNFEGMDMAKSFYCEMCNQEFLSAEIDGKIKLSSTRYKANKLDIKIELQNAENLNLRHMAMALNKLRILPTTVCFSWKAFSDDLYGFLLALDIRNVEVMDYGEYNDKTPRSLLNLQSLSSLSFRANDNVNLPKKFLQEVKKKRLLVMLNGVVVNSRDIDMKNLPIELRLDYSMGQRALFNNPSYLERFLTITEDNHINDENDGDE